MAYVISTLQSINCFGSRIGFFALLFMSTTGISLKRTKTFCDHNLPENSNVDQNPQTPSLNQSHSKTNQIKEIHQAHLIFRVKQSKMS